VWQRQRGAHFLAMLKAENDRHALRKHFDYLVRYANDIIILADEGFHIIEANDRALESYGYGPEEMTELTVADLIAPEDAVSFQDRLRRINEEGALISEGLHRRKDGTQFQVESSARFIEVEGRRWFQAIIRDVTERRRAEETIRQQYYTLKGINESVPSPIFSVDLNYCYTSFNKAHAAVMKSIYGTEIKLGGNLLEYQTVAEDSEKAKRNLDRALEGEYIVEEVHAGDNMRLRRYFEVTHNPIRNDE